MWVDRSVDRSGSRILYTKEAYPQEEHLILVCTFSEHITCALRERATGWLPFQQFNLMATEFPFLYYALITRRDCVRVEFWR